MFFKTKSSILDNNPEKVSNNKPTMKVLLNTEHFHDNLMKLSQVLDARYYYSHNKSIIELNGIIGDGTLYGISFDDYLNFLVIDFQLSEPLLIGYETLSHYHPLKLIFCEQGRFDHLVYNHDIEYKIGKKASAMSSGSGEDKHYYNFAKEEPYKCIIIELNRALYLDRLDMKLEDLPEDLQQIFETDHNRKPFFYLFPFNVTLTELFESLFHLNTDGILTKVKMEGKIMEILSLMLELATREEEHEVYNLNQLHHAKAILLSSIQDPPTIQELSKKVALSQTRLKAGFKESFGNSIYQYIIKKRMEMAGEMLINNPSMPIQEIAENVGYANKSQFSKQFKKIVGILPKDYRKKYIKRG